MGCCFDINLNHNENKAFSALFDQVVGRIVVGMPGAIPSGLFLDVPVHDREGRLGLITLPH